jgi:archaeosine synthase
MPFVKLVRKEADGHEVQLAMTTPERGVLSLTLDGARILARHGRKRVRIGDFRPKGTSSLFAVGVEGADPDVREGDEVVVVHGDGDDVRAVGVARMSAEAMTHLKRGVAVTLRHTASEAKPTKRSTERTEPPELVSVRAVVSVDGQGGRA